MKVACLIGLSLATGCALYGCGSSGTTTGGGADGGADAIADASGDATGDAHAKTPEAGSDGGGTGPIDTTALTPNTWTWIPVAGAICRDGSPTGMGINLGTATDKLMIYLEGGGACFNALTCDMNLATFGETAFNAEFVGASASHNNVGILSRSDAANAVKDWNFVYVPYCTGDVHAGDFPDQTVPGVTGKQQFVGYENVGLDLARIVPSFPGLTKVLLTGVSAGGFGAAANYAQVATAFGSVPVYDLDDSGPPMPDPYNASCLQSLQSNLWGFDKTLLTQCGSACPDPTNYPLALTKYALQKYPNVPFGLIESTDDGTISEFFGFGADNCSGFTQLTAQTFTAGIETVESALAPYPNFGAFIFTGTQHTSLGATATYDNGVTNAVDTLLSSDAGPPPDAGAGDAAGPSTIKLTDWVAQLVAGTTRNVGP